MSVPSDAEVDHCISTLYEAVLDPALWESGLEQLAALGGAAHASLTDADFLHGILWRSVFYNIDDEANELYFSRYAAVDPRSSLMLAPSTLANMWVSDNEAFDAAFRASSTVYKEYFAPRGVTESVMAKVAVEGSRMGALGLLRTVEAGAMPLETRATIARVLPHADRAIRLARRMTSFAAAVDIGRSVLDAYDEPVASVDADGSVLLTNGAFDRLLAQGTVFRLSRSRVSLLDPSAQRKFALALREATDLANGVVSSMPRSMPTISVPRGVRAPLQVSVAPLMRAANGSSWFSRRGALVKITDPARAPSSELLQKSFGLTRAEARVCGAVMEGGPNAEIARRLNVAVTTLKSQLASIYAKTHTKSRASLVLAIRSLPR
jgi:DNA-binding CsgD family transcriptional regulator